MPRTDRLYDLIQILRDGRLHRAQDIADRLGVSLRTVYRDMETLSTSGVPIEGERGRGYQATAAISLPPLNLTLTELEALHLGLTVVGEAGDSELQAAARTLSAKIDALLPEDRSTPPQGWGAAVYPFAEAARGYQHMPSLRGAIRARQKIKVAMDGAEDIIRPLALDYWGRLWTVTVWSETARDFKVLRLDQMENLRVLPQLFVAEPGTTLADYRAQTA
jgi:predicted DNA-binding transcriptional regulator YafY